MCIRDSSGGLHGVGAKCVNALSIWFKAEIYRDGKVHYIEFSQGKTTKKLDVIGKTNKTGTKITFMPDAEIFTITTQYKFEKLHHRLRELAFLNPGITIVLSDEREDGKSETFFYKDGIVQFVKQIGENKQVWLVRADIFALCHLTFDYRSISRGQHGVMLRKLAVFLKIQNFLLIHPE